MRSFQRRGKVRQACGGTSQELGLEGRRHGAVEQRLPHEAEKPVP